jgi:hypothetical protein
MPIQHLETDPVRGHGQALGTFAGDIHQATQTIVQSAASLAGAWRGPSSDQFAEIFDPELRRLAQLANDGLTLRDRLLREIEEWERVDSRFGDAAAGGAGGSPGAGAGEATPAAPPSEAPPPPYKVDALLDYTPDYPDGLGNAMESMHAHFMDCVRGNCPDSDIYREMAEMTGLSEEEVREQFTKAVESAKKARGGESNPALNSLSFLNDGHWGSRRQLMFGKVVGDHLGIHPVFAAFLNPSGGLIGPGAELPVSFLEHELSGAFDENAWDYHGAAHDAFGYLYNQHHLGPGYQYVDSALNGLDKYGTGSPLSGQISGYVYWARQMGVSEYAIDLIVRNYTPYGIL